MMYIFFFGAMNHGKIMMSPWDLLGDLLGDQHGSTRSRPRAKRSVGAGAVRWGHAERFSMPVIPVMTIFDAIHLGSKEIQTRDI